MSEQVLPLKLQCQETLIKPEQANEKVLLDASISKYAKKITVPKEKRLENASHMPVITNSRKRCAFCATHSKESRSKVMCKTCKVGLCVKIGSNCFELFHAE